MPALAGRTPSPKPSRDAADASGADAVTHMITYAVSREHLLALMDASPAAANAMRELVAERYGAPALT